MQSQYPTFFIKIRPKYSNCNICGASSI